MIRKVFGVILALYFSLHFLNTGVQANAATREIKKKPDNYDLIHMRQPLAIDTELKSVEGRAYAIYDDANNELAFFRSNNDYTQGDHVNVTDIKGNIYSGYVYPGIETNIVSKEIDYYEQLVIPWQGVRRDIKKVYIADGQTIKPKTMMYWFYDFRSLKEIDLTGFDISNVSDISYLLYGCSSLTSVDLRPLNFQNVKTMSHLLYGCSSLNDIHFDWSNLNSVENLSCIFTDCKSISSLDLSTVNAPNVTNIGGMFSGCSSLKHVDLSGLKTNNVSQISNLFSGCQSLTDLNITHFDTQKAESMIGMFAGCSSLQNIDLSSFNTSKVIYMSAMFSDCSSLKNLDLSNFDTSSVFSMNRMFGDCTSLETLKINSFNTSKVEWMHNMFENCTSLTSVDISNFDTSRVTNFTYMFKGCNSLKTLNLKNFNIENATNLNGMFTGCKSLEFLDISNFNTAVKMPMMTSMFDGCESLGSIILGPNFTTWKSESYLPEGVWENKQLSISLTEKDLYKQYPANAKLWCGTWTRTPSVQSIEISDEYIYIPVGSKAVLSAVVNPSVADQSLTWSSSNSSIVSVDSNGGVLGNKVGRAIVTATASNGKTGRCVVRVLFLDVPASSKYYSKPVYWALDEGITNGYTDSDGVVRKFRPQSNCTREAVVTFLWRLAGKPEPKNLNSPFSDVQDKGKYYYKAVLWAVEHGITKGYSDGTFKPNATCLREHVVTFLWRYAKAPSPRTSKNPFNDIKSSDYYYKAALWANENRIANGYSSGEYAGGFGPKLDCLREHVVTFLHRYDDVFNI